MDDSLFAVDTKDGSITVATYCRGLSNRKVTYDSTGREMNVFPNPVESDLNIVMGLIEDGVHRCELVSLQGKTARVLFDGDYRHGTYTLSYDVSDLHSGVYLVRMKTPTRILTKRILIIR